jgi:hypothetical protein
MRTRSTTQVAFFFLDLTASRLTYTNSTVERARASWKELDPPGDSPMVIRLLLSSSLVALMLGVLETGVGATQFPATISVCDLLRDLETNSGRLIALRGQLRIGFERFTIGEDGCEASIVTLGHKWPSEIWAGGPTSDDARHNYLQYADQTSVEFLNELSALFIRLYWSRDPVVEPPFQVSATLVGVLRTKPLVTRGLDGRPVADGGFGHLNEFPAEIDIIAVRDVSIVGLSQDYTK